MKTTIRSSCLILCLFGLIPIQLFGQSDYIEKLIEWDTNHSLWGTQLIHFDENGYYLSLGKFEFDPNTEGRHVHGEPGERVAIHLDLNGVQDSSSAIPTALPARFIHGTANGFLFGVGDKDDWTNSTISGGGQLSTACKKIAFGSYNLSNNDYNYSVSTNCNLKEFLTFFESGGFYYLIYKDTDGHVWFEKRTSIFVLSSSTQLSDDVVVAAFDSDNNEVYLFNQLSTDPNDKRVEKLELDGTVSQVFSSLNFSNPYPQFLVNSEGIYEWSPKIEYEEFEIQKWNWSGQKDGDWNFALRGINVEFSTNNELLVVLHDEASNKPVKMVVLDDGLSELGTESFGFNSVIIQDMYVLDGTNEFVVTGSTSKHFKEAPEKDNEKAYFLKSSADTLYDEPRLRESDIHFSVFPNPTDRRVISVQSSDLDFTQLEAYTFHFYNATGQQFEWKVLDSVQDTIRFDVANLKPGGYWISIEKEGSRVGAERFLVE